MARDTPKPVIFLAFANERDDRARYLRNLPEEARRLRTALEGSQEAGLCELVLRANATIQEILDVFQKYRNRVAVFHYGGHANGYQLLLESSAGQAEAADAGGLAAFLGGQAGLELVFLNGCATQGQVQGLLDANVSAVIATSRAVDDQVATDFSAHFYQGLGGGADIRTAYDEAAAAIRTARGESPRALYWVEDEAVEERWPWELYLREGAEVAARWNLPDAAGDPLFGLPPLPELDLPESPFRHLHWFTREHSGVFFGRGYQIRELYDRVTAPGAAPIILFYGQSGVGKSSLLAAGLLPRLEGSHGVQYVRRGQEAGLMGVTSPPTPLLPGEGSQTPPSLAGKGAGGLGEVAQAWLDVEEALGQPLVVILDQAEEVYTRPQADPAREWADFLAALQAIFADPGRRPRGRLIPGFRKEWLAEIKKQVADHKLYHSEVFLERLDRRGIVEAVSGPAASERLRAHYGLSVAPELPGVIADDLLEDRDSPVPPTLQILLTRMWEEARQRKYARPSFDLALYQELKRQGILLGDLIDQGLESLKAWWPELVESGLALDVLAYHTTPRGTAEQRGSEDLRRAYRHRQEDLPPLVGQCQDLYLLVDPSQVAGPAQHPVEESQATRLAHDTLAPLVRRRFDESDRPGQLARRVLENRAVEWKDGAEGTPLAAIPFTNTTPAWRICCGSLASVRRAT